MANNNKKDEASESLDEQSTVIEPTPEVKPEQPETESETLDSTGVSNPLPEPEQPRKPSRGLKRLTSSANLYFLIFILLFVLVGGGIFAAVKLNNKNNGKTTTKTQSLTDEQIAALKGNTTLVGDSSQVLDIQGNAVFENQVLMRKNLDVAGSIKVGGSLSLPAITVGGSSSFGQIQVNDTLSVSGNTTLQGQLNIQKNLAVAGTASFNGTVSAGQLNVGKLQLTGDLTIARHIATGGGTPSKVNGSAIGGGGTTSLSGNDTAGTITVNTGGGPSAGCFVTINFVNKFNSTPHVIISPSNSSSASLNYYTNRTTSNMSVCTASAPAGSTTYLFDYAIFD